MKQYESHKTHFILLVVGTIVYLYTSQSSMITIRNDIPEANLLDTVTVFRHTICYIVFVVLLFGHALLWCSQSNKSVMSEEEMRKSEAIKACLESKKSED